MAVIKKTFNVMALPLSIERANPIPVDSTAVWYSLEEMKTYATTAATAYVGQILTLVDEASNSATAYVIENATGDLKEVGSATQTATLTQAICLEQTPKQALASLQTCALRER